MNIPVDSKQHMCVMAFAFEHYKKGAYWKNQYKTAKEKYPNHNFGTKEFFRKHFNKANKVIEKTDLAESVSKGLLDIYEAETYAKYPDPDLVGDANAQRIESIRMHYEHLEGLKAQKPRLERLRNLYGSQDQKCACCGLWCLLRVMLLNSSQELLCSSCSSRNMVCSPDDHVNIPQFCAGCKVLFPSRNLTTDRIEPGAKGGTYESDNTQILCESCNRVKFDKDVGLFEQRMADLDELGYLTKPEFIILSTYGGLRRNI